MIYDRTCSGDLMPAFATRPRAGLASDLRARVGGWFARMPSPGLSHAWAVGGGLYSALGRLDDRRGFDNWLDALRWVADYPGDRPIGEIQFWGHGKWGAAKIGCEPLDVDSLAPDHPHHGPLEAIRRRMVRDDGLWWFRTCETFGASAGHRFAQAWTDYFDCRAAGHTYIIGPWQSGLHSLRPGRRPDWSVDEGLAEGSPDEPKQAHWSNRGAPNTITFLHGAVPTGF